MRPIKTANIKVDAIPVAAAKKDIGNVSKEDFMEQFESFLAKEKKTETKSSEPKEVLAEEHVDAEENEEDFDEALTINLLASFLGEAVELPTEEIEVDSANFAIPGEEVVERTSELLGNTEDLMFTLESLLNENESLGLAGESNAINQAQVEEFLLALDMQLNENPELEVQDLIEGLLSENETALGKALKNADREVMEGSLQGEVEPTTPKFEPERSVNAEINEMQEEGIEEVSIEQPQVTVEIKDREPALENDIESQEVELSTVEPFEPFNQVDLPTETSTLIQNVAQEDFVSTIETLMIEETELASSNEKVTTARIQLTPERLGKVDLQIEMNGKELTAKLFVEQQDTKEWIDQQVAHLKEKLLTQEITVKDFQVVVHEENLNDAFMNSEDNPFFKQKEKDSQARKEQRILKNQVAEVPVKREERSYSTRNGISILV